MTDAPFPTDAPTVTAPVPALAKFSVEDMTLGEVAMVEDLSGLPIGAIADDSQPKGKALTALVFVALKRTNPAATYADAQAVPLNKALAMLKPEEESAPKAD